MSRQHFLSFLIRADEPLNFTLFHRTPGREKVFQMASKEDQSLWLAVRALEEEKIHSLVRLGNKQYVVYGRPASLREYLSLIESPISTTSTLNFDDFRKNIESLIITFVEREAIKCTCSRFLKNYICEHVVHSSVDLKERSVPMEYQDRPIGSGPVAGRPVSLKSQAKKKKESIVTNLYCHELMSHPPRKMLHLPLAHKFKKEDCQSLKRLT